MSEKLIITLGPNTLNALAELFANVYVGVNSPRVESCKLDLDLDLDWYPKVLGGIYLVL